MNHTVFFQEEISMLRLTGFRKHLFAALLALILGVQLLPVCAQADSTQAAHANIIAAVEPQIRAYADSIDQPDASGNAAEALAVHGIRGGGKALNLDASSPMAATLLNSELVQTGFSAMFADIIQAMQQLDMQAVPGVKMAFGWYGADSFYGAYLLTDSEEYPDNLNWMVASTDYAGKLNSYDNSLDWMAANCDASAVISCTGDTGAERTYQVAVTFRDRFDFSTANTSGFKKLFSGLGMLLFKEFDWSCSVSFQISIPYSYDHCTHTSGAYHWTYDSGSRTMVCDNSGTCLSNAASPRTETAEDGTLRHYFELENPVRLFHNKPWVLEYDFRAPGQVVLAPVANAVTKTHPQIAHTGNSSLFAVSKDYAMAPGDDGTPDRYYAYNYYGMKFAGLYGFSTQKTYTYRLENVIAANGSNMIYLTAFETDTGVLCLDRVPLDDYYYYGGWMDATEHRSSESNWLSGKDLYINYLGTSITAFQATEFDLRIWENGPDAPQGSYWQESGRPATCTEDGYTLRTCSLCGITERTGSTTALGHSYAMTKIIAPTCTGQGYTLYSCSRCGDSYQADVSDATGHKWDDGVITKTATFAQAGEKVFTCFSCKATRTESYEKPLLDLSGTTMTLGDSLDVGFVVDTGVLEDFGSYAVVTKTYADGREAVSLTIPQTRWKQYDKALYYFSFDGVAAKEMCDSLSVQIFNAQGMPISNPYTDSIRDYAMRMLGRADVLADEALRTLYVDMLNYGAQAQLQFGYDTENLANRHLTQAQQAYASGTCTTKSLLAAGPGRAGTTLTLKSRITLDFIFHNSVMGDFGYAIAAYTDPYGVQHEIRIDTAQAYDEDCSYVCVPGLAAADYAQAVTCTVYDAAGNAVAWATDSMEGYIHRMTGTLPAIAEAIAKFGASAYRYFHAA